MKLHITGATGYLGSELARLRPDASTEPLRGASAPDDRPARAQSLIKTRLRGVREVLQ